MTTSRALKQSLPEKRPVLFVYIGWAEHYDGTEAIKGNFLWVRKQPTKNSEHEAFIRNTDGYYYCGAGRGILPTVPFHVVFVARDPADDQQKVVGLYAAARSVVSDHAWKFVRTKDALLLPPEDRLPVPLWPGNQGVRRWARRADKSGVQYPGLYRFYRTITARIIRGGAFEARRGSVASIDAELSAFEGAARKLFVTHRQRETKLRSAKIRSVMRESRGRLRCEVPGCGFDFVKRYGEVARGYAQIHHLRPLKAVKGRGHRTRLTDLAVVCANCHAIIHLRGGCRPLAGLVAS